MRNVTLRCYRCAKEHDTSDMRYASANRLICKACMEKAKNPDGKIEQRVKPDFSTFILPPCETKPAYEKEKVIEYICMECNYSFKRKKSAIIPFCPYCSAKDSLEVKTGYGAENLLRESTGYD